MPSIFPGMDPYLEHPDLWPEVHHWLISLIAEYLIPQVRPKYKVAIEKRIYQVNQTNQDDVLLVGIPDVTVKRQPNTEDSPSSKVAVAPPTTKPVTVIVPMPEQIKQGYLEVRDMNTGAVVTAIEVLSPVNKRSGEGRETYLKKRQRVLGSLTNLVEIDLLRAWKPMPLLYNTIESDYRVLVSREERRPRAELYTCNLPEQLPTFSLPLRPEDSEPIVDLQAIINSVYERGGYDYQLDYDQEPVPAFSDKNRIWAQELLRTDI
ncbi:MAG: DUF4058 family protein [Moorea sp. SIO1F2]|uniref:DUF4058 family protein n=1 Tax=Moorena sp. SIO1F2 TaxID=2607819 RepID=UPI0013BB54CE|nr:DUF4058 family protein [Moorena sp. SIO1F2]NET85102.1 DUF4058 family protein [Moorena sp. SIO1F2]